MDQIFQVSYSKDGRSYYSNVAVKRISRFCAERSNEGYELQDIQHTVCSVSDERALLIS